MTSCQSRASLVRLDRFLLNCWRPDDEPFLAGTPDAQLNPKKKIFEKLKPDLRVDAAGFATFRGAKWILEGKGHFKAPTATDAQIS